MAGYSLLHVAVSTPEWKTARRTNSCQLEDDYISLITCRYTAERPPLLHRQLMSVFVSAGLISAPGTPCENVENPVLKQVYTHTHTLQTEDHRHAAQPSRAGAGNVVPEPQILPGSRSNPSPATQGCSKPSELPAARPGRSRLPAGHSPGIASYEVEKFRTDLHYLTGVPRAAACSRESFRRFVASISETFTKPWPQTSSRDLSAQATPSHSKPFPEGWGMGRRLRKKKRRPSTARSARDRSPEALGGRESVG